MASSNWPDGSPTSVDDIEYELLGSAWSSDGLFGVPGDTTAVYANASGTREVKFRAGKYGLVHGHGWYSGTSDIIKTCAANASGNPRIDLAVLGLDRSTWQVTEYIKTGTPAASPAAPALQRDAAGAGTGKWEIPLAYIAVAAGATVINAADVTSVAAYLGSQGVLHVADLTTLERIPGPVDNQRAWVSGAGVANSGVMYVYRSAVGWRRADWNSPWGIIGGKEYTGNGAALAVGITSLNVLNLDSGTVTPVVGRRYRARMRMRHTVSTNGLTSVFQIQETNTSGIVRAVIATAQLSAGIGYESTIAGEWNETSGSARTFVGTGYSIGGSMSVYRTTSDNERAYLAIEDIGPAGVLSYPN